MEKPEYKLHCVLMAHTKDVRGLAAFKNGNIVSVSRDKTAIFWKHTEGNYKQAAIMTGHSNFVSSVCIFDTTESYPNGLIVTGSNDNHICLYNPGETEPITKFKAHENTVCGLSTSNAENNEFFSCSWDVSVKLWSLNDLKSPKITYVGHSAAAWCVADLKTGLVLSGGADKTVIVWLRNGNILHKLNGHTDCVRGIAIVNENEFLTCANDASVKHWNALTGAHLNDIYGHQNYIYSISASSEHGFFATSGEDQTLRLFWTDKSTQTLQLPTQSVWCVKILPNKDVVCGGSDGDIRIFTCAPDKYADSETLIKFEEAVVNFQQSTQKEYGGKKLDELPDTDALLVPGKKDGDIKVVKDGNSAKAYSWSQRELKWNLVGDVMESNPASSDRTLYNGIEYDYVFSVDIQEGVPPLKLPYNKGQDPWHVAQKFIEDNDLSQMFLEQVANFIIKNSQSEVTPVLDSTVQHGDPFTGGNRYIPSSTSDSYNRQANNQFTSNSNPTQLSNSYIPITTYLKLEQANLTAIHEKLKEFNAKQENQSQSVSEDKLNLTVKLVTSQNQDAIEAGAITVMRSLLNWPDDIVFPVLDIARLAVLHKNVNEKFCTDEVFNIVKKHLRSDAVSSNQMLTFRLLANMFNHETGEKLCLQYKNELFQAVLNLQNIGNKNNQVAVATYFLNCIIALNKTNDNDGKIEIINVIIKLIELIKEPEAVFRILVGLGSIIIMHLNDKEKLFINYLKKSDTIIKFLSTTSQCTSDPQNKLRNVALEISNLINNS